MSFACPLIGAPSRLVTFVRVISRVRRATGPRPNLSRQAPCMQWFTTSRFLSGNAREPLQFFEDDGVSLAEAPNEMNYFDLFDVPESFDLDTRSLQRKFRQLQATFHPDRHATKTSAQRAKAESWSSLANRGYNRLLKPLERAQYMLELRGRAITEEDVVTEPSFLAEVMEANEEVTEAESPADLVGISKHNRAILDEYAAAVSVAFKEGDIDKAREITTKMRYYSNIQDKIVELEAKMGIVK